MAILPPNPCRPWDGPVPVKAGSQEVAGSEGRGPEDEVASAGGSDSEAGCGPGVERKRQVGVWVTGGPDGVGSSG